MSKAIYVKLTGGLGNQMFQYASAFALAKKNNAPLFLETSFYKGQDLRIFELKETFKISSDVVDDVTFKKLFPFINTRIVRNFIRKLNMALPLNLRRIYTEKNPNHDSDFLNIKATCLLIGYWQSYKYFDQYRDEILKEFTFSLDIDNEFDINSHDLLNEIKKDNSVFIHIRRGDYVTNLEASKVHGTCDLEYYKKGIKHIKEWIKKPTFFVFSDDIKWCKENLREVENIVFTKHTEKKATQIDLYLMSSCAHGIIANSTFSWWAAWMNNNKNKIIVAPARWNNINPDFNKSLIPPEWVQL